jgi:hypothetical protein
MVYRHGSYRAIVACCMSSFDYVCSTQSNEPEETRNYTVHDMVLRMEAIW